jgi:thymidylate kinase
MFNIVLEGIDGSGKSTVAPLVFNLLHDRFPGAVYRTKKWADHQDPYLRRQLTALQNQIWVDEVPRRDSLGPDYWILLIAAWYAALNSVRLSSHAPAESLHVFDGWYYRSIVKTILRSNLSEPYLWSLFANVTAPDVVFLLDVAPRTCWQRTSTFNEAEVGRWAGHDDEAQTSFLAYQDRVRSKLLRLASERGWIIIAPGPDLSPDQVAATIARAALAALPGELA